MMKFWAGKYIQRDIRMHSARQGDQSYVVMRNKKCFGKPHNPAEERIYPFLIYYKCVIQNNIRQLHLPPMHLQLGPSSRAYLYSLYLRIQFCPYIL